MAKQGKQAAAGTQHVVQAATFITAQGRRHHEPTREESRIAKRHAQEVRSLLNEAKRVAKRAKAELAVLSRKLKRLLDEPPKTARGTRGKTPRKTKRHGKARSQQSRARSVMPRRSQSLPAVIASP